MSRVPGRFAATSTPAAIDGWQLQALTPPSRLFGANGLCAGPDGRLYVAQVSGSQISAIDVDTGAVDAICPKGGDIVAPDDLVFDASGNLYATEITEGRVSVREPNGRTRVLQGDMPCANPITLHQGRLFAGECRMGGRILELDLTGGPPRVLLENLPMPNAMQVGPDGLLYFPLMAANQIWRVALDGGAPAVVASDLGMPDAVKFDASGHIVSTQVASGQVLRIDPRSGERRVLADLEPGLDNLAFLDGRLFVSSICGQVSEITASGEVRALVPRGFNWPLGLALDADGVLFIADGPFCYTLAPGGAPRVACSLFSPGSPGYARAVAASGPGELLVTTGTGALVRYWPARQHSEVLASGFDELYGVAVAPGGAAVVAERATGRVLSIRHGKVEELAAGLQQPVGVAVCADGTCLVTECGAGRVVKLSSGRAATVVDGLQQPQGIVARGALLYIVDAGAKELIECDLARRSRRTLAAHLPLGAPPGVTPRVLRAIGELSGPMGPFAGLAGGTDGTLYLSGDADGSILALRPRGGN